MIATDVSRLVQARRASDVYYALKPIGLPGPMPLLNYSNRVGTPFDTIPLLIREVDAATVWRLQTVRQYRVKLIAWTSDE
ncbi:hypothetical protein Q1M64_02650 (plasmid) [Sinorhizobium meliloti]|nr:hypothetical protein Q1M65_04565 [Sinorhizobium meliloti]WKL33217.1 hypothetical protein Q1M62_04200 [Sinorhizobium meliloti]WKL39519.1 hypothetical protein Q1M64_02650 [Sinorhizobium meliloti]